MPDTSVLFYLPNHFERNVKPHLFNKTSKKEIMQILANFDADDKKFKATNNNNWTERSSVRSSELAQSIPVTECPVCSHDNSLRISPIEFKILQMVYNKTKTN